MTDIKHISFDLWGTLLKSNPEYKPRRNTLLREIFGNFIQDDVIAHNKETADIYHELTAFQPSYISTIGLILGQYIRSVDKGHFVKDVEQFRTLNDKLVLEFMPLVIDGVEEILSTLIENNKTISILSNTSFIEGTTMRKVIDKLFPKKFKFQLYSDQMGIAKPDKNVYFHVARNARCRAINILHVGDNMFADSGSEVVHSMIINANDLFNCKEKLYEICNLQHAPV